MAPCNPSVSGWAWIGELKKSHKDRVKITFVGRAQLDGHNWCAGHQDIVRALHTRDEILTKAEILNQEKAVLAHPGDLADRVQALAGVVDDVDPAWTLDFSRIGSQIVQTLRPKHPSAQQTNPITVNFTVVGSRDDPDLSALTRALDYGSFTPVRLPGELVTEFRVTGSPLVELDELERAIEAFELHPWCTPPRNSRSQSGCWKGPAVPSPPIRASCRRCRGGHGASPSTTSCMAC